MRWGAAGAVLAALAAGADHAAAEPAVTEITQYGITWTFDRPVRAGQFITGDWWVIGAVTVTSVSPAPGKAPADEQLDIKKDQWGNTSLRDDDRMRNGSMIVRKAGPGQGYDSRSGAYRSELSVTFPYRLAANETLISTISHRSIDNLDFCHQLMWSSDKNEQVVLKAAAALTALAEVPPADAFRPPYAGTAKPIFRAGDLKWDLLGRLKPVEHTPSWEQFERYFQRPWLDHISSWGQRSVSPNENQPAYGRECGRVTSIAALMVHLDVPRQRKQKLVIGMVQRGIDLWGLAQVGAHWCQGGGHGSGRKWPILFASLMLDEPSLLRLPPTAVFHEDVQTYYGQGWFGQTALYWMVNHHGPRTRYEEKPPEQWQRWDRSTEGYRCSSTAQGWIGTALAARLMGAIGIWNHDAFFDYCDRWMRLDDPYKARRGKRGRPAQETKTYDPFVTEMWRTYRQSAPAQPMAGSPRKWVWEGSNAHWAPNPKPADAR
jgi:hypothetical protein